jgi:hypothetical protein
LRAARKKVILGPGLKFDRAERLRAVPPPHRRTTVDGVSVMTITVTTITITSIAVTTIAVIWTWPYDKRPAWRAVPATETSDP